MNLLTALAISCAAVALVGWPLVPLARGSQGTKAKVYACLNLGLFLVVILATMTFAFSGYLLAAEAPSPEITGVSSDSHGWAFLAAALAVGFGSIGAGIAVAAAAPAAIGALAEDSRNFGKAMIFVGLGEGLAIFGLLVAILILQRLP